MLQKRKKINKALITLMFLALLIIGTYFISNRYKKESIYKDNIKVILGITQKITDGFISVNLDKIISDIIDRDFNDAYYIEMCKINKLKLVTDDSDLLSSTDDIEIITERKL